MESTTLRKGDLQSLSQLLIEQHARKLDVVAPATAIRSQAGQLVITGTDPIIDESGVTPADGTYSLLDPAVEGLADKLRIPLAYMRRIHTDRPDIFDANVNGWLMGPERDQPYGPNDYPDPDKRSFLLRCFRAADGDDAVVRAVLSNGYGFTDHLDLLTAGLDGISQAGVPVEVLQCDLSDRRMYVKISAPEVQALAPLLLDGYRSPFTGETGADNPTVFAGLVLANSETGGGAATITPQITVQVCTNGMTMTREDQVRRIHLGSRLQDGIVDFSADTHAKHLALITAQARDAVAQFLTPGWLEGKVAQLQDAAGVKLSNPADAVEDVTKALGYTEAQTASVLSRFIEGGLITSGGVMHAVTAAAQDQTSPDVAAAMEADALRALELAAAMA